MIVIIALIKIYVLNASNLTTSSLINLAILIARYNISKIIKLPQLVRNVQIIAIIAHLSKLVHNVSNFITFSLLLICVIRLAQFNILEMIILVPQLAIIARITVIIAHQHLIAQNAKQHFTFNRMTYVILNVQ